MSTCTNMYSGTADYTPCAARAGDKEAQYQLGMDYFHGNDTKNALKWLDKAASKIHDTVIGYRPSGDDGGFTVTQQRTGGYAPGHQGARMMLARIYGEGLGVDVDNNRAQSYRDGN